MLRLILGLRNPIVTPSSKSSQNCSLFPLIQYVIYIIYATCARYEIYNTIDYYLTNTLAHLLILTGVLCTKTSLDYI